MEKLNDLNFKEKINNGFVLVDFYADWCGPCRMMHPVLEEVSTERSNIKIMQVNVDDASNTAKEYGVMSIPTLILFKDGMEVAKKIGFIPKEQLLDWIHEFE